MTRFPGLSMLAGLFRPAIRIALAPHAVNLVQGRALRQAGVSAPPGQADKQSHTHEAWQAALDTLLPQLHGMPPHSPVDVVLSHHFCGVHLLDAPGIALSHAETRAWISEQLADRLGEQARTRHIAWQPTPQGTPILVASMLPEALTLLQNTLLQHHLHPRTVRPWLAACCDTHWATLRRGPVLLALSEPGMVCLASLAHGQFCSVRCARSDAAPAETLAALLARESLLHPTPSDARCLIASTTPTALSTSSQLISSQHTAWQALLPLPSDATDLLAMLDVSHAPR